MKTFLQQYEAMFPPPLKYDLAPYDITSGPLANTEKSGWELRPVTPEDTAGYAADDVVDYYRKYGRNTTRLGPQMTDEELRKHYGLPAKNGS